jgi:hypothetical protein
MLAFLGHPGTSWDILGHPEDILGHPEDILGHPERDLKTCEDRTYPESLNL